MIKRARRERHARHGRANCAPVRSTNALGIKRTMSRATPSRRAVRWRIARTVGEALWRHRSATAAAASLMILARLGAVSVPIALKHLIDGLGHNPSLATLPARSSAR